MQIKLQQIGVPLEGQLLALLAINTEVFNWFINQHTKDYECQCVDTMFLDNDRNLVMFPNEQWKEGKSLFEVRHKLNCSASIEILVILSFVTDIKANYCQLDSFEEEGIIILHCCHFGSKNMGNNDQMKVHRITCYLCKSAKQSTIASSNKINKTRAMKEFNT